MNTQAVISADLIASTALNTNELRTVKVSVESFFRDVNEKVSPDFWGRIIKGDAIECVIPHVKDALRIALMLKCMLKSLPLCFTDDKSEDKETTLRKKYFYTYGARMVIGLGEMRIVDSSLDIMDGEAMYLAGRKVQELGDSKAKRITIKQTLFIESNESLQDILRPYRVIVRFMDDVMNGLTAKQATVMYYKLLNLSVDDMMATLHLTQPTIHSHLSRGSWHAIQEGLEYYESTITELLP